MPSLPASLAAAMVDPKSIQQSLYLIPLIPMLGALINGLFGKRLGKGNVAVIAVGAMCASLGLSLLVFASLWDSPAEGKFVLQQNLFTWFKTPNGFQIDLAYAVDRLSGVLLLVITGVGLLIHLYSVGYMEHDDGFWRFFAYLNLFVGMMLTLVMGANLLVLFVGWEGVGLASYLLIGFWYEDDAKAYAGRKAFVANRVGDFGFLLGIFTLLSVFGTVDLYRPTPASVAGDLSSYEEPLLKAMDTAIDAAGEIKRGEYPRAIDNQVIQVQGSPFRGMTYGAIFTLAVLLLFVGATGKSAQIPLYVWLPDAMAGPTPVSALIHAATMVTAGVYMSCRLSYLVVQSPTAMLVIALVGASTALFAAVIGTQQNDIKKVLAYSTVSQLGFMVLGVGVGAFWAASLHLLTHAFFKACLFLGAGTVMHGMANETNIWKMGGLKKDMPVTRWTFLIGTIAITGVIPISGFFSKDAILDLAHHSYFPQAHGIGWLLWGMGSLAALGTSFYMFRAYLLTFEGERREMLDHHAHETILTSQPLVPLAALSILAAYLGIPLLTGEGGAHIAPWENFLEAIFAPANHYLELRLPAEHHAEHGLPWLWWGIAWIVALVGFGIARSIYGVAGIKAPPADEPVSGAVLAIRNKFYVDEFYEAAIINPIKATSNFLWRTVDQLIIDTGLVRSWGFIVSAFASLARQFQNGSAQRYATVMALSLALILLSAPIRGVLTQLFPALFGH